MKIGYVPLVFTGAGKIDEELGGNLEKVIADRYDDLWNEGAFTRKEKHLHRLGGRPGGKAGGTDAQGLEKAEGLAPAMPKYTRR